MIKNTRICGGWHEKPDDGDTETPPDLRRHYAREIAERISARSQWLPESDRQIVLAIYNDGKSIKDIAALTNTPCRVLRARVRRLVMRITTEVYEFVALYHESWPATMRAVAEACIFRGLSIRETAELLGMSYHTVRSQIEFIRLMHRAHLELRSLAGRGKSKPRVSRRAALASTEMLECQELAALHLETRSGRTRVTKRDA